VKLRHRARKILDNDQEVAHYSHETLGPDLAYGELDENQVKSGRRRAERNLHTQAVREPLQGLVDVSTVNPTLQYAEEGGLIRGTHKVELGSFVTLL